MTPTVNTPSFSGIRRAARAAGCTPGHIRQVALGNRLGSAVVRAAIAQFVTINPKTKEQ